MRPLVTRLRIRKAKIKFTTWLTVSLSLPETLPISASKGMVTLNMAMVTELGIASVALAKSVARQISIDSPSELSVGKTGFLESDDSLLTVSE